MTASLMIRRSAAALLAVALGLAALPGCGGSSQQPAKKDEKKDEPKPGEPNPSTTGGTTTPNGSGGLSGAAPTNTLNATVEKPALDAADAFVTNLNHGTASIEALSPAFVKVIGKPLVLPSEQKAGFSTDAAASWLKKVSDGISFNLRIKQDQVGDVVYIRGVTGGVRLPQPGSYSLRLVKDGGAWKVDWLSLSSVTPPNEIKEQVVAPLTAEGAAQAFAIAAFTESVTDLTAMPKPERMAVLAAAMTPPLRAAWAPPSDQDKAQGYDYWPNILGTAAATKMGGGTIAFTAARVGDLPEFKVELTKLTGKKTYLVKLVPGNAPHEWLVNEVTEVPGAKG